MVLIHSFYYFSEETFIDHRPPRILRDTLTNRLPVRSTLPVPHIHQQVNQKNPDEIFVIRMNFKRTIQQPIGKLLELQICS